jgi:hypothetical protein
VSGSFKVGIAELKTLKMNKTGMCDMLFFCLFKILQGILNRQKIG